MIFLSIALFIKNSDNVETLFVDNAFKKVVDKHRHMKINKDMVDIPKDSFVYNVAELDHEFDDVLDVWHKSLSKFINSFIAQLTNG